MAPVPPSRIQAANTAVAPPDGRLIVYWMTAQRRLQHNPALQHAVALARDNDLPLVIVEAVRCDYPFASHRFHAFILQGMADNRERAAGRGAFLHTVVETAPGDTRGLLAAWARLAHTVVADAHPGFFFPKMLSAAAAQLTCPLIAVDGIGLLPLQASPKPFARAHDFRRHLQKTLPEHLEWQPLVDPLAGSPLAELPENDDVKAILGRWPQASDAVLAATPAALQRLPIDASVPVAPVQGGSTAAIAQWQAFLDRHLAHYGSDRNHPDASGASGLSPWLHFGHISPFRLLADIADREGWSPDQCADKATAKREGWWGLSPGAEAFLDELITWRELGHHYAHHVEDPTVWESLPAWARTTLEAHAHDTRDWHYTREQLAGALTHDRVWNAAQRELVETGRMHNYLRMLWGKRILEWSAHPRDAMDTMFWLNDRYALDGRDPNTASGVGWVLGRFDRAWGPVRPIFGKIRYMSSENTVRKLKMKQYLARWGA